MEQGKQKIAAVQCCKLSNQDAVLSWTGYIYNFLINSHHEQSDKDQA